MHDLSTLLSMKYFIFYYCLYVVCLLVLFCLRRKGFIEKEGFKGINYQATCYYLLCLEHVGSFVAFTILVSSLSPFQASLSQFERTALRSHLRSFTLWVFITLSSTSSQGPICSECIGPKSKAEANGPLAITTWSWKPEGKYQKT